MSTRPNNRGLFGKFDRAHPLGQELEAIRQTAPDGDLKARSVVDWARAHLHSALHAEFEWNNTRAAEQYRLEQARRLIRVWIDIVPPSTIPARVMVSLPPNRGRLGYVPMQAVMADAAQRQILLAEAYREMRVFVARYRHLRELARVISVMQQSIGRSGIAANAGGGQSRPRRPRRPRGR
jgi:hypothetical protein